MMQRAILLLLLNACPLIASGADTVYVGTWLTTNRKLDGTMTCVVRKLEDDKWQGRFHGIWQGVPFDYTVPFTGEKDSLRGTAQIDGAQYTWTGSIDSQSPGVFKGSFGGSRYAGGFELKEKPPQVATQRPREAQVR